MSHFEFYGRLAKVCTDEVEQNGRYQIQKEAEKNIPSDVCKKMVLKQADHFLDIGCGTGINLRAALDKKCICYACDHENVIDRLREQPEFSNVEFYPGNFLNINFERKFSKILIYGVVPTLPDEETLFSLIDKATSLLESSGLLLIGDISNIDRKKRFLNSNRGKIFQKEWEEKRSLLESDKFVNSSSLKAITITDDTVFQILKMYRDEGYQTYLLNQPQNLPFGNTREDIIIVGPEYDDGS